MKKISLLLFYLISISIFGNGITIYNDPQGLCLTLVKSKVDVTVNNQVAVIKATQTFRNNMGSTVTVKYGFPLNEDASATQLKWQVGGMWYVANISPTPQDTSHPGGNINENIKEYLGDTPLYFSIPQEVMKDSLIVVELTYVELLKYEFGKVYFTYPNDYHLIQQSFLTEQTLNFNLISGRTIDSLALTSHSGATITNNTTNAQIYYQLLETPALNDYEINYSLSLSELGLFGFSSFMPDSVVPDTYGKGFFTFIAEPDPSENTQTINKRFTFIVDRSGSMYGQPMEQAIDAAKFVVNHLNEGDKFNIISFAGDVTSLSNEHLDFNPANQEAAISYINTFIASGSTNISGAFGMAVPQFTNAGSDYANIIIFFTDGEPTAGITGQDELVSYINNLVIQSEANVSVFNFGVGSYVNKQLLNLIASNNNGFATFLETGDLLSTITEFYLTIRNPVLLDPVISFQPNIVNEIYPVVLPDLYKGKQLIISGRYLEAIPTNVKFSGMAFGSPVEYNYNFDFSEVENSEFQFLTKIWAKSKIEHLLVQYYNLNENSPEAIALKEQIITISQLYGVITEFTSFSGGIVGEIDEQGNEITSVKSFELLGNYPNPFNPSTTIRVSVNNDIFQNVDLRIYNSLGQLIRVISFEVHGKGIYEVNWDGRDVKGNISASGVYFYSLTLGNTVLVNKMILNK